MELLFTTLPGIIATVGGIAVVCVVGTLYVLGLYSGKKDNADDRLISILQTTVDELGKKVDAQGEEIEELTVEVEELRKDNRRYIEILQGRDEQTKEFYKQAFESMKISKETHTLVAAMATTMSSTNTNIEKLIDLLGKHADVLDHSISSKK